MGSLAPVSPQLQCVLCLSSVRPQLHAPLSLFSRLQAAAFTLILVLDMRGSFGGATPLLPILQHQAQPNRPGKMSLAGRP